MAKVVGSIAVVCVFALMATAYFYIDPVVTFCVTGAILYLLVRCGDSSSEPSFVERGPGHTIHLSEDERWVECVARNELADWEGPDPGQRWKL